MQTNSQAIWLQPELLQLRLDANFNNPQAVAVREKIRRTGRVQSLAALSREISCGPFGSTLTSSELDRNGDVVLVQPTDISEKSFTFEPGWRITEEMRLRKGLRLYPPETVVFARVGIYPHCGVIPARIGKATISSKIIAAVVKDQLCDPYFIMAFFNTQIGTTILFSLQKSTAQPTIGTGELGEALIPCPGVPVQTAVGNKLRAAESLTQIAGLAKQQAAKTLAEDLSWDMRWTQVGSLSTWIQSTEIESRFDAQYNSADRVAALRHFRIHNIDNKPLASIAEVSAMIGWKGLTTEYYMDHGPLLIRGIDFDDGIIHFEQLVHIDEQKYEEQPQIHLREGDIILTKDGTIGKACTIPASQERLCAGSTVARIKVFSSVESHYLEAILNHEIVQVQIRSMATGLAQPHITQEWIAQLRIPLIPRREDVAEGVRRHHECLMRAKHLTNQAIIDVESMVEGKLDEATCLDEGLKLADEFGFERP